MSARIVMQVVKPPEPARPVDKTTIIEHHTDKKDDPPGGFDALTTVDVMSVYLQGAEPCRIKIMPRSDYQAGLDRYKEVEGIECPYDRRPTIEQCSAFLEVLKKKDSIYGDYAILMPHGDRGLPSHGGLWTPDLP